MVKAADALQQAGYHVRVVSTRYIPWANATDSVLRQQHPRWEWDPVEWQDSQLRYLWTGARRRATELLSAAAVEHAPTPLLARAKQRAYTELVDRAIRGRADIVYGGGGALAATARTAQLVHAPFVFDLEDFHSAEEVDSPASRRASRITAELERRLLPRAAALTTSSEPIADAYMNAYGIRPVVIHNTFELPPNPPALQPRSGPLRLYWFSQTVGPDRGLEDVVRAAGLTQAPMELHLRGNAYPEYIRELRSLAHREAPKLTITVYPPASPDRMISLCEKYDVGLSLENRHVLNHDLCLSNKSLTYMLAGLALAVTNTAGQRELLPALDGAALLYEPGDVNALADGLRKWHADRHALRAAQMQSWDAARSRWHWEHPAERGALVDTIRNVVPWNVAP
jgi:glycosyltransferase involved in cell wall biosynthesis